MIVGGGIVPATNFTRHEVQRPRPPQVAVTSTPPSCAAFRMLVPAATVSSRRVRASPGSVKMTSETAIRRYCTRWGVLLRDLELDAAAALALDGGRGGLGGEAPGLDAARDERVAHRRHPAQGERRLCGGRRAVLRGQRREQLVEPGRRLALGEPPREQPQRLLAQRRVAAVLGPRLQALAQRFELERLDLSKREDGPKLQADRRLV